MLVLDGVYVDGGGILRFHEAMPPNDDQMDRLRPPIALVSTLATTEGFVPFLIKPAGRESRTCY